MASTLSQIRDTRLEKIEKLRKLGINPYPSKATRTHTNEEVLKDYTKLEGKEATVVGRIMAMRGHGAVSFIDIRDQSDKIQLYVKEENIKKSPDGCISHEHLDLLDVGDFVQATGVVTKTQRGEISIEPREIRVLTKAIRPLPEKWEGLKDIETKLRRRYLDMTMNPQTRNMLGQKSIFWKNIREFLISNEFVEIRTPVLEHTTGGADANPFVTHHEALDTDFYLRISLELPLKRAIGGGFEKVFEIGPVFRNEGIDDEHLQDYDMLEFYWAYADYHQGMTLVKDMYRYTAHNTFGTSKFEIGKFKIDLDKKWEEIDYSNAIKDSFGIDVLSAEKEEVAEKLQSLGVDFDKELPKPRLVDTLWKQLRKDIAGPAFLVNQPKFVSPLAKADQENPAITERYQVILAGSEMGNGYSELNDPIDQYNRFTEQQKMRDSGDDEAQMLDVDFVEMLEYGMPPTTGMGVSERLYSFLVNKPIRQTTMFPQMKRVVEPVTKEIYGISQPHKVSKTVTSTQYDRALDKIKHSISQNQVGALDDPELISIDPDVKTKYNNLNVGCAIIKNVSIEKTNPILSDLLELTAKNIKKALPEEEIDDIPQIRSYHDLYGQMGVDTNKRKSSPEALLRRIVEGKELYSVNACVDAYNLAVILNQISAGAFDLDKINFPVILREAKDGEEIEIIGGETKKLKAGELCYFDQKGAYNMDFNFRDADRTKVTEDTKNLWINVEGINKISRGQVASQLKLAVELITGFCGGELGAMGIVK